MKEILSVLEQCALFDQIRPEDLQGMLGCLGARPTAVKKGQTLFHEGDPAVEIGIVITGSVQLVREDYYGNRSILAHIGPGELFGESYAFSKARVLPVSIIADEDCRLLLLDSRRISVCCSHACSFHSQVIFNLLRLVATKNLMLHQKIQITSNRTTRDKLMAYLMHEAKLCGCSEFTIPYDRQALADYLEVDRSGLSAEISKLRKEGILRCEKNRFQLLSSRNPW